MSDLPPVISRLELAHPQTLAKLDLACRDWGLFYLTDHGLGDTQTLFNEAQQFFDAAKSAKDEVRRTESNPWGFFDEELTKNTRDWKETFDFGARAESFGPQWPDWHPTLRAACEQHYVACEALSYELLSAISDNLGVGGSFLFHAFEPDHASFLRLNYYPHCPQPAAPINAETPKQGYLGVNHHTDAGALTLLLTDAAPGLEVFVHDTWQPVPPLEDALIINLGDVIQVWSNDRYKAPIHRVRCMTQRSRMSIPFFFNPKESFVYAPLQDATEETTPHYRPIHFGEFRRRRAAGDYANLGEEIQIDQFRIDTPTREDQP